MSNGPNLSFLSVLISNSFLFQKIKSALSVTKFCILYKSLGVVIYYSVYTLLVLCLAVLPLTPSKYGPNIYFSLVVYFIVIGQLGRSLLIIISFYSHYVVWPTMTCSLWDNLDISVSFCVYPSKTIIYVCKSITSYSVSLKIMYGIPLHSLDSHLNSLVFPSGMYTTHYTWVSYVMWYTDFSRLGV